MNTGLLNLLARRIIIIEEKNVRRLLRTSQTFGVIRRLFNSGNADSTGGSLVAAFNRWMTP